MQISAFDYVKDSPSTAGSLAKLATLIHEARREAAQQGATCLLFDNGDTFQGTPVADLIAREKGSDTHPMVAAMKLLKYDAGGLGNHDFDHGLTHLRTCLQEHDMPVVCSNFASPELPMIRPDVILAREVILQDGYQERLRIGVLSSLPDKTAFWSRHHVADRSTFAPPVQVLRERAMALRNEGADIIVVLAHMGLALFDEGPGAQNQISEVAAINDIDVVIGGHTHLRFPGPDHASVEVADSESGTVAGTPVVQPGASAADLGVIDLKLLRVTSEAPWQIAGATVQLRSAARGIKEDPQLVAVAATTHAKTRDYLAEPVARLTRSMHSFFALAHPSPMPALLATAKYQTIAHAVAGTEHAKLPLLAVASAPLTGGFDGPDNFLLLKSGQIERRHIAGMNPYANHVWAVKTTGAQLIDWLERSALIFNTLWQETPDQMLIDPRVPGFRYDAVYGLSYIIDPRQPPRFDTSGKVIPENPGRIREVQWNNSPLDPDQVFLVATTDHRAGGGGLYKTFANSDIVVQGHAPLQEAVLAYLRSPDCHAVRNATPWKFQPKMQRQAILLTAPEAANYLEDIAHLKPEKCGKTADGFLRVRLHL